MLKRLLGIPYAIEVEFESLAVEFTAFKNLLRSSLQDYQSKLNGDESWSFALLPFPNIEVLVLAAKNAETHFAILELPEAENRLDLL